ncbi:hypothetical protein HAX54_022259 [Datura stramonium]|uniref:Uncharacterized protein n=1 Tax=Datura stramonium TaxID=4076 RepID=A0ABS8UV90_DATST|nr:hypothetical protein [Datura stramonium]
MNRSLINSVHLVRFNFSSTRLFDILNFFFGALLHIGVESAAIQGGENYVLEVVGEHVDAVVLTNCLRKKLGQAQLESVGPVVVAAENNNNNNVGSTGSDATPEAVVQLPQTYSYPDFGVPQYQVYQVRDPNPECCSIM